MGTRLCRIGLLAAGLFIGSSAAAQDAPSPSTAGEALERWVDLSISLQAGYLYNLRNPSSGHNELRVFDHASNSFSLDLAQIVCSRDAPVGGVGYRVKLSTGRTAQFIHSLGLGIEEGQDPSNTEPFDLTEAFIEYVAPLGNGVAFRVGKFVTYHGAEVIEAKDNMNYSRSLLFDYAVPLTHTGIMVGYRFSGLLTAQLYAVNGWDAVIDNNSSKTMGLSLALAPTPCLSTTFNVMYGPEQSDNNSNNRFLFDWVATARPFDPLTLSLNADYGFEEKVPAEGVFARWYGVSTGARYELNGWFSVSVRLEYFKDDSGSRTGQRQDLKEVTLTPELRLAQALILRPEYRRDWSTVGVFDSGRRSHQDTIGVGVLYSW